MTLLALAVAPGLAICLYFFLHDVYDREPAGAIITSFLLGLAVTVPAILLQTAGRGFRSNSISGILISAFLLAALIEEGCKFGVLRLYAFRLRSFDEPLDGIVYSVMISMGFATLENAGYVLTNKDNNGLSIALMRMFTSVPAHASFAVIMGYYAGKAKFDLTNRNKLLAKGLLFATIAHGFYDAFLFLNSNTSIRQYLPESVSALLLMGGAMTCLLIALQLSRRLVRLHKATSRQLYTGDPILTIRHALPKDIALIVYLARRIWPVTYNRILPGAQIKYMLQLLYHPKVLARQMAEGVRFIIVYNGGMAIGFASYGEVAPNTYKLHKLYMLPSQQGRGSGKFTIDQIISDIQPQGAGSLILNVNKENGARAFYEKLGFTIIREEKIDIGSGFFMDDYVMEKSLTETAGAVV